MNVLVTGGTGYIGSHTVLMLLEAGHNVLVVDNLCNSSPEPLDRIEQITGRRAAFIEGDIRDAALLNGLFSSKKIDMVIHFAGLKAVGESVEKPLWYYQNNVQGSLTLFDTMARNDCKKIVFSSSATVYGDPASVPITEDFALKATNPYGQSKLFIEEILRDLYASDSQWQIALLRYFNPVGAHPSGLIGEDPAGIPNNLMPYVAKVAIGALPELQVFGNDYPTADGTGIRDYIHVVDLADGHLKAMHKLGEGHGCKPYNLGTGNGYSVLEVVEAFAKASGREVPYKIVGRRPGDIAECYADPSYSERELNWKAARGLDEMVSDHWNWQQKNPQGY